MTRHSSARRRELPSKPVFSAIDLGTNNCRLLVAVPSEQSFRVVDAYSQIVRLGQGVGRSGRLSDDAMARTVEALTICAQKMTRRGVRFSRNIATQACRSAENGEAFLERIEEETGLAFDLVTAEEEATLSVRGCSDLIDPEADAVIVFDIGGGSTEISWLRARRDARGSVVTETVGWTSLPLGVVTLAETADGPQLSTAAFAEMAAQVTGALKEEDVPEDIVAAFAEGRGHLVGTSGTVTSLAGVHLALPRYQRRAIDGLWMTAGDVRAAAERLRRMSLGERAAEPCVGPQRADLVVPGCAVLEGILGAWPAKRVRVGDRGLREGLLIGMMERWRAGELHA